MSKRTTRELTQIIMFAGFDTPKDWLEALLRNYELHYAVTREDAAKGIRGDLRAILKYGDAS
jgi:hypothetical protein